MIGFERGVLYFLLLHCGNAKILYEPSQKSNVLSSNELDFGIYVVYCSRSLLNCAESIYKVRTNIDCFRS